MVVIKNGCGLLGLGTLKSAVSQEWTDELGWFLLTDTNLWKLRVTLIIIGLVWSKMVEALKIVGLLNQVYLTNDLMYWADRLNDFSMLIVMEYYFFAFKWCPILAIVKLYVWEKSGSQVIDRNPQHKSDGKIF